MMDCGYIAKKLKAQFFFGISKTIVTLRQLGVAIPNIQ
jgi:hypothetical protein